MHELRCSGQRQLGEGARDAPPHQSLRRSVTTAVGLSPREALPSYVMVPVHDRRPDAAGEHHVDSRRAAANCDSVQRMLNRAFPKNGKNIPLPLEDE